MKLRNRSSIGLAAGEDHDRFTLSRSWFVLYKPKGTRKDIGSAAGSLI